KGERPSNVLIFGKTGTGKTAVVKYIENEFRKADGARMVQYLYLNCEIVDTPYGVLQSIGNKFIENFHQRIPFTGLSTDRVYSLLLEKLDEEKRVVIVALDEIDKLVQKNGDDILYQLLKINDDLSKARVSLIGISNELTFTEYLDPRVRSRLADEKMVFPPYNADELYDILTERSRLAFENGTAADGVLQLIAALAAQEHGDARRALDLLRVSAELAERQGDEHITEEHVQRAKNKIELDTVIEAVKSLPTQSKLILLGILLNEEIGNTKLTTGEVYTTYRDLSRKTGVTPLTQRRVTDLISELDMLGLVHARVRSFGRGGRTKEIQASVPLLDVKKVLEKDEILAEARGYRLKVQTTLLWLAVPSIVRFFVRRFRFGFRRVSFRRRGLRPPLPGPSDLREPRRDVLRPSAHPIFQDEREREEEEEAHEQAVPAVLRRARVAPAVRTAGVRRLEGELQEAEPGELAARPADDVPLAGEPSRVIHGGIVVPHRDVSGLWRKAAEVREVERDSEIMPEPHRVDRHGVQVERARRRTRIPGRRPIRDAREVRNARRAVRVERDVHDGPMDDRRRVARSPEDDHVPVVSVRRVARRPALEVRDDVRAGRRGLLEHHVPRVDHAEERLAVRVLHRRALDDHEGRPHAGVEVDCGEEDDHDDRRHEEVPCKPLPEILVFFLVILVSRTVAGHGPFRQGWESV
ncbi:MAG TPA: ORC1-type DNA replication protein, partial [Thermoplasmata archaeon]|nr:ORC1-type DNA replication protein [Thermoplasmata archaeon]